MFDTEIEGWLPRAVDTLPPGPILAALLAATDVTELSGHDRVRVLKAHQRMVSHYQAELYRDMVAVTNSYEHLAFDADLVGPADTPAVASGEIQAALVWTRAAADGQLAFALELKQRLPKVWNRFAAGDLDLARVRVLVDGTAHLDEPAARKVVDGLLDEAGTSTTGQLRARLRKRCIDADPDHARNRYEHSVAQRKVVSYPKTDGTADLVATDLEPQRVSAAMERINRIARSLRGGEETRSMDQLRADVLLDLLEGTGDASRTSRGVVDIHVDLATLTQLSDSSAELAGYGPVIADIAQQITQQRHDAEWRYTVDDPDTGTLHTGITRRRPTTAQRRYLEARWRHCVFPGCRMPASGCDLDHRTPHSQGGPTSCHNLTPCCRRHHLTRHHGWQYIRLPNGDHHWTSPLGHTYTTRGPPS